MMLVMIPDLELLRTSSAYHTWDFPKIRVPLLGGPYNKDPTNWGIILGSPISETPT